MDAATQLSFDTSKIPDVFDVILSDANIESQAITTSVEVPQAKSRGRAGSKSSTPKKPSSRTPVVKPTVAQKPVDDLFLLPDDEVKDLKTPSSIALLRQGRRKTNSKAKPHKRVNDPIFKGDSLGGVRKISIAFDESFLPPVHGGLFSFRRAIMTASALQANPLATPATPVTPSDVMDTAVDNSAGREWSLYVNFTDIRDFIIFLRDPDVTSNNSQVGALPTMFAHFIKKKTKTPESEWTKLTVQKTGWWLSRKGYRLLFSRYSEVIGHWSIKQNPKIYAGYIELMEHIMFDLDFDKAVAEPSDGLPLETKTFFDAITVENLKDPKGNESKTWFHKIQGCRVPALINRVVDDKQLDVEKRDFNGRVKPILDESLAWDEMSTPVDRMNKNLLLMGYDSSTASRLSPQSLVSHDVPPEVPASPLVLNPKQPSRPLASKSHKKKRRADPDEPKKPTEKAKRKRTVSSDPITGKKRKK